MGITPAELQRILNANPDLTLQEWAAKRDAELFDTQLAKLPVAQAAPVTLVSQTITLPPPVSANRYWRNYNGRTVVSEDAKAYKAGVWCMAQQQGLHPFCGPVAVYVHLYRPQKRGDLDNANKVLLDALKGIAYQDDDQITELHSWRHDDKNNPRVEVEIRKVTA